MPWRFALGEGARGRRKTFLQLPMPYNNLQGTIRRAREERDMHDDAIRDDEGQPGRRTRLRWAGLLAAALASAALLAAACSGGPPGSGAASAGPSSSGSARASGSAQAAGLALARCMRSHGVPKFPDPNSQGGIGITPGDGVDLNSPQFQAAQKTCQKLVAPQPLTAAQQGQVKAGNLKYAQCMRSHGISDFPDPNSQGQLEIQAKPGSDLQLGNPRFQSANKACQHYQYTVPGGPGPALNQSGGGS
jgi:hypothetical protein